MKLVTGGAFQGKSDWVRQHWHVDAADMADGADCDENRLKQAKAVNHFHLLVKRWLAENRDPMAAIQKLVEGNKDIIVITDAIGSGIVPIDREERIYREVHGRVCCWLAGEADEVVRVICGIGQKMK